MKSLKVISYNIPKGIQQSNVEREQIDSAIYNVNLFIKDLREAKKWAKGHEEEEVILLERVRSLIYLYKNELLPVEHLANGYAELYREKYYKAKLEAEKLLGI